MSEPVPDCEPPLLAQVSSTRMMPLPVLVGLGERERECFHLSVAPALSQFHSLLNISRRLIDLSSPSCHHAMTRWRARQKKLAGYAARSRAGRHQAAAGRGVGARQPPAGAARAGLQDNFIGRRATYMYRESRGGRATRESRIEHWDREMYHYHSVLRRAFHQCRSSAPDRARDKMENRCVR